MIVAWCHFLTSVLTLSFMEDDSSPVGQFWSLPISCQLQQVILLAVDGRNWVAGPMGAAFSGLPHFNPTKPNVEPARPSILALPTFRLLRRTSPHFATLRPRSFSHNIIVCDPLFIHNQYPLQKWIEFGQGFADGITVRQAFYCGSSYGIELLFETNLLRLLAFLIFHP